MGKLIIPDKVTGEENKGERKESEDELIQKKRRQKEEEERGKEKKGEEGKGEMSGGGERKLERKGRKERQGHWQSAFPVFRKHARETGVWRGEA